jgi:hypothetical protein
MAFLLIKKFGEWWRNKIQKIFCFFQGHDNWILIEEYSREPFNKKFFSGEIGKN